MQRENKWQDRFDEKFGEHILKIELHNESLKAPISYRSIENEIRSFIQSEIDTAIAEERKKVVKELEQSLFAYTDYYEFDKAEITKIINNI